MKELAFVFLLTTVSVLHGQNTISGKISTGTGEALPYVSVYLLGTKIGTTSDKKGKYILKKIPDGSYKLFVSHMAYVTVSRNIEIQGKPLVVNITLEKVVSNLNKVVVTGKNKSQKLSETAYKPEIIEMQNTQIRATAVIDLVGRFSGIRIRKQGGLGSESSISINGISGKGIRTFIDGIPVDLLGKGFHLNNISSNIIKRIEVYKGVIPVTFGADALGGVINIITKNQFKNYFDVSYAIGSWNTHLATLSSKRYLNKNKTQFIQTDAFFNHSDNDYWMHDVDIITDELGNTKKGKARRFNDDYSLFLGRFQYGFQHIWWADDFRIMLSFSKSEKQWQHGISAELPWGEAHGGNRDFNSIISWKKNSNNKRWKLSAILGYNFINESFTDISNKTYLWDGTTFPRTLKGESGYYVEGRTPTIDAKNVFVRTTTDFKINEINKLNLTTLISYEQINGEDKAGTATFKKDIYKTPQKLTKTFVGASIQSIFFDQKLTNIISGKLYYGKSYVVNLKTDNSIDTYIENKQRALGYGDVLKYQISKKAGIYLGYEYTVRLPDREEIFGDGIVIGPNPNLKLEQSHNINIGTTYKGVNSELYINGFYRNTKNQIYLIAVPQGLVSYFNLFGTETKGVEASYIVKPLPDISVYANATWQSITMKKVDVLGEVNPRFVGENIPNIPYLFGNFGVSYTISNLFTKNKLLISYENNYVNKFLLGWGNQGIASTKATIPTQFTHNASLSYSFPNQKYSLSLELRNLTNQRAFDNYKIEKPGRSLYFKIRIYIN